MRIRGIHPFSGKAEFPPFALFLSFLSRGCSLAAFLLLGVGFAGCGMSEATPLAVPGAPPWNAARTITTPHYAIRTNLEEATGRRIGDLMERAAEEYRRVLGGGPRGAMTLYLYADRASYEQAAQAVGLPPGGGGFYDPRGAIHVPYLPIGGQPPEVVLLHEGAHQYLHETFDFRLSPRLQSLFSEPRERLMSVPYWLQEGVATYMECSRLEGDRLMTGLINPPRLEELQRLIRTKRLPPLASVLSRTFNQSFDSPDYAVAWGIVWWLCHGGGEGSRKNRDRLRTYLEEASKAFFSEPEHGFATEFLVNERLREDFWYRWHARIGAKSLEAFETIIVGSGTTLKKWEKQWIREMARLRAP